MFEPQGMQKGLSHCVSEGNILRSSHAVVLLTSRPAPSFSERVGPGVRSGNSRAVFSIRKSNNSEFKAVPLLSGVTIGLC